MKEGEGYGFEEVISLRDVDGGEGNVLACFSDLGILIAPDDRQG